MVKLSKGISAELMGLGDVIKAHKVLLFLAGKESADILQLLSQSLVVLGKSCLHILVHQIVFADASSILDQMILQIQSMLL